MRRPLSALVSALLLAAPLAAQCPTAVFSSLDEADFGAAVAVRGELLLAGDPTGGSLGGKAGVAWVMRRGPWSWAPTEQWLPQPGTAGDARFGAAVALGEEYAAVGAPGEAGAAGAVYAWRRDGDAWLPLGRFLAPDAAPGIEFGTALAIDGARLAVGAPRDDQAGVDAGAVHVFDLSPDGVTPAAKLLGTGLTHGDRFGASLALRDGVLAAGARDASFVWVWEDAGAWQPTAVFSVDDAGMFGHSLALDGDRLLVGSPTTYATGIQSGAAHLFVRAGGVWSFGGAIVPPEPLVFARFGLSVALDGDVLAVGAPAAENNLGSIYVMHREGASWVTQAVFESLGGPTYAGLGMAVSLCDDVIVAGALTDFGPSGVVYVFGGVAPWEDLGGGVPGAAGQPTLAVTGSLCGGHALSLRVTGGKPLAPSLTFVGFSALAWPVHGGTLWPAPDVVRFGVLDPAGELVLAGTWPPAQPGLLPVYAQTWIADATVPGGLSATPGLRGVTP